MSKRLPHDRPAVVLVNRCFIIHEGLILTMLRAAMDNHLPLRWEAPGGKLDEGQDLHGALEREVMEETGLLVRPIDTIAHLESKIIGGRGKYAGMPYVSLFGLATVIGGKLKLSHEHDDARWCTYAEIMELDLTPETQKAAIILENRLKANGAT
jgi:8-oxo-dGTP diphosphatase